jgi:hypothetical protein
MTSMAKFVPPVPLVQCEQTAVYEIGEKTRLTKKPIMAIPCESATCHMLLIDKRHVTYEEKTLHCFTGLCEIVVFDGGSHQLGFSIGVLDISMGSERICFIGARSKWLTMAAGGLTYFNTVRSFLLRIWTIS